MQSSVIISWDGDSIGQQVGRATLADDIEAVRRIDQAINRGNDVFKGWALSHGGSVVEAGGDEGRIEVPASALTELPRIREAYRTAVDATVSVGIGKTLSQSAKALLAAKLRGKDRVVVFNSDVEQEVASIQNKPEGQKLYEEYLSKAAEPRTEGSAQSTPRGGVSAPQKQHPRLQTAEHSQGEVARQQATPPTEPPKSPYVDAFHKFAAAQDQSDRAASIRQSEDFQKLKESVAGALTGLRQQLPVLAQLKSAYPDTYKAVVELVQSVVTLARGLQTSDSELAKKEATAKIWRESTGGFGAPISIPGGSNPNRASYDRNYLNNIAASYAGGDVGALQHHDLDISELEAGNSGRGVVNKDRYKLYHRMLSAGDRPPPIVVTRSGTGWKLLDGTHRLEAARAAKVSKLPAVEVKKDELVKAVASIPAGMRLPNPGGETFDYNHVLTPEQGNAGYQLRVHINPKLPNMFTAQAYHDARPVGSVNAFVWTPEESRTGKTSIEPHSVLNPDHHGLGLGKAMYEAAYTHAMKHYGASMVEGGKHSDSARRVHESLSRKHGFTYQPKPSDHPNYPNEAYQYALKGEMEDFKETELDDIHFVKVPGVLDKGAPDPEHPHRHLNLPPGTQHHGQVKVTHGDGKTSWKGVRAGMVQSQTPGEPPTVGHVGHPVSSREPSSR